MDDAQRLSLVALDANLATLLTDLGRARSELAPLLSNDAGDGFFAVRGLLTLEEMERRYVQYVLAKCDCNKTKAAAVLQLDASTLHRKLAKWAGVDLAAR